MSRGTLYFDNRPLLVSCWGSNVSEEGVKEIHIWFKLTNVPDCYWTEKGPSRLASVIG